MREHPDMLGVTIKELAEKLRIYIWEASFLVHSPGFMVREDLKPRIYEVLLARRGFPLIGYGPEFTKQRLYRYISLDIAEVFMAIGFRPPPTPEQIEGWPEERQKIVVGLIEGELRAGLGGPSK